MTAPLVQLVLAVVGVTVIAVAIRRTLASRTRQLEAALAQVEEARRLQDEFVANTSHELFTPLTAIMASVETIAFSDDDLPPATIRCLDIAQSATLRMKRLIENILAASGVATHIDCARETFEVGDQVRAAIEAAAPQRARVRLRAESATLAIGDAERFRLIVTSIVDNAVKFSPEDAEVIVDVSTDDDQVHVVVIDDGPGIPADERDAVFRRFYQVDGSATRTHGGAGLGLFLARHLAVAMGGTIDIDETRAGTSLRLVLPAAADRRNAGRRVDGMLYIPLSPYGNQGAA
jgi:signal transduction histidine kinase